MEVSDLSIQAETPYTAGAGSKLLSLSDQVLFSAVFAASSPQLIYVQFSLSPDPRTWGSDLSPDAVEADDDLHNPDTVDKRSCGFSSRGLVNLGFIIILCIGLVTLL